MVACCALVSTKNRFSALTGISLPSIRAQVTPPDTVLIANDGEVFKDSDLNMISSILQPIPHKVLKNSNAPGVAGAWNHGLRHLISQGFDGYVAILDDDDQWDTVHLSSNLAVVCREKVGVVVSGLRMQKDGNLIPRALITKLSHRDFYAGNPGWQGSNTFVHMREFLRVGGFRDGLASTNDRDLAIRLLMDPLTKVGFTGKWTATWCLNTKDSQLSSQDMPSKLSGLRWFWHFYGVDMTVEESDLFFNRSEKLFGFSKTEITSSGSDLPLHRKMLGDLHAD
jgi:GT2 family glycosyltransferase